MTRGLNLFILRVQNLFNLGSAEWLNRLDQVKTTAEEKHKLTWELQKRREEVADMQRSCSEVRVALFDERQANLHLKRENEELNLKAQEDRKRIAELLSIIEPVEQDIVLAKDLRPEVTTKFAKNDLNINANKEKIDLMII
jgi:coiled-coil domain-containing protein 77